MGRNNTKAVKNIAKMYEQLGLTQDDIFHKTKLLLSIYRDMVWATLSDCNCVNEEIYYYGDDLTDALVYLRKAALHRRRNEKSEPHNRQDAEYGENDGGLSVVISIHDRSSPFFPLP